MIVVAVTMTVKPGKEGTLVEGMRNALAEARNLPGLRYTKFARKVDEGATRFLLLGEYTSSAAMHAASKIPRPEYAYLADLVESYDWEMWEAVDIEFDLETGRAVYEAVS